MAVLIDTSDDRSKNALVTGGTGYVGSQLVRKLLEHGWVVHLVVRRTSSLVALAGFIDSITIHYYDGSTACLTEIVAEAGPDVVYHVAAFAVSEHEVDDVEELVGSNVLFSTQLVEAMVRNDVRHFVNTETFWQHRGGNNSYDPVCLYAATKQAFHDILLYYVRQRRINALSLLLYDIYGPNDPRKKLFTVLKDSVREGKKLNMTLGEQLVDITHVDDVATAYLIAADILQTNLTDELPTYCVSSGNRITLRQLINVIEEETGLSIAPVWGGKPYRENEVMIPWVGTPLPGWSPEIDLAEGVRQVFIEECSDVV